MASDNGGNPFPDDSSSFEAGMRERPDLMAQMAGREKWDGEARWVATLRRATVVFAYIAAFSVILWIAATVLLTS